MTAVVPSLRVTTNDREGAIDEGQRFALVTGEVVPPLTAAGMRGSGRERYLETGFGEAGARGRAMITR